MDFRVLGTIEVAGPSPSPSPPGAKERAILARLLLDAGRTVPADALLEAAWQGVPREAAARSLAVRVANLRSFLEPGRDRGAPSSLLVRDGPGYRLAIAPEQVDAHRFERCVRAAAGAPARRGARGVRRRARAVARHAVRRPRRRRVGAGARSAGSRTSGSQAEEGRARALVELGRPLEAVAGAAPAGRRRPAARGARLHADARALRRGPPGRGARGLPRARGAAARARACARRDATRALERRILEHDRTLRAPAPRRRRPPERGAARRPAPVGPRARARPPARGAGRARSAGAARA